MKVLIMTTLSFPLFIWRDLIDALNKGWMVVCQEKDPAVGESLELGEFVCDDDNNGEV